MIEDPCKHFSLANRDGASVQGLYGVCVGTEGGWGAGGGGVVGGHYDFEEEGGGCGGWEALVEEGGVVVWVGGGGVCCYAGDSEEVAWEVGWFLIEFRFFVC